MLALNLVLNSTFFTFNDILYKQVFSIPMGFPLSSILANIVMQDLEERVLSSFFYQICGWYCLGRISSAHIPVILSIFNFFHERLKFTIKIASDVLNFLDVSIIVSNNLIKFDWYRKPTFSGRFLNFFSQHPLSYKKGVIIGLIDRVFKFFLLDNGYPLNFIFNIVLKRLRIFNFNLHDNFSSSFNDSLNNSNENSHPSSHLFFFIIPYISNLSDKISIITKNINLNSAFVIHSKLNNFIKLHKDHLRKSNQCRLQAGLQWL